jgi:hypothetical protein
MLQLLNRLSPFGSPLRAVSVGEFDRYAFSEVAEDVDFVSLGRPDRAPSQLALAFLPLS